MLLNPFTLLSWSATLLAVFIAVRAIARLRSVSRRMTAVVSAVALTLALGALVYCLRLSQPRQCSVAIIYPPTGTMVASSKLIVSGTVEPSSARVAVVVRSETDTHWWVQEIVRPSQHNDRAGKWSLTAHLGDRNAGTDENFQIIALASDDNVAFNLITGRFIRRGLELPVVPLWNQSNFVIVRRVR